MENKSKQVKNVAALPEGAATRGGGSRYTCADYRDEMRLMGMQRRLAGGGLGEDERLRLETQIAELQRRMQMD